MSATFYITQPYVVKYFHENHSDSDSQPNEIYQTIINHIQASDSHSQDDVSSNYLKWEIFNRHCYKPLFYPGNRINAQLKCDQFYGSDVKWEGSVYNVEIKTASNILEKILSIFPNCISNFVTCWFGEPNELMFDVYDSEELEYFKEENKCNLNNWNTYEFRIGVKLNYSPIEMYLNVHHSFTNFTRLLTRSDQIWFTGTLLTSFTNPDNRDDAPTTSRTFNLENYPIWIDLKSIGCIKCNESSLKAFYKPNRIKLSSRNVYNGMKYLFNVLFNPLIRIN